MTKLRDLRAAIADFKKSGKKVVAYSDGLMQAQYYLAAQADEVYLHPQGMLLLEGFGRWRNYYKEGLDRYGIDVHVFRVGEYKSAVEPYLRNDMSPEAKEMSLEFYGDLWRHYLADIAAARKIRPEDITSLIDAMPDRLRAAGGDMAKMALDAKMVDKLAPRDVVRQRLIDLVGEDEEKKSFRQIGVAEYLQAKGGDRTGAVGKGQAVAVVVAKGEILDGAQPAGTIGGDSTARVLRRAREDDAVKAVVLRVDSPGGSAFASEIIRRECELVRKAGKPLVVSMGSVAASGGYWISTASDEIWAAPETITGSIGIFGIFPTIDKPLAKYLGVHTDGVGTTRFSDVLRPDRPMDPAVADVFQQGIDHGYEEFLARVAQARKMTPEQVDKIARGRRLERRGREGHRARGPARRPRPGDRVGGEAREAREGLPRLVRREGEELPREADVDAGGAGPGRGDGGGLGLRALAFGLRPLGGRAPAGPPGRRRAARSLERPARRLRPLPLRRRLIVRVGHPLLLPGRRLSSGPVPDSSSPASCPCAGPAGAPRAPRTPR